MGNCFIKKSFQKAYLIKWSGGIIDPNKINETVSTGIHESFAVSKFLQMYNPKIYRMEILNIRQIMVI